MTTPKKSLYGPLTAMLCVTGLATIAMLKGINGALLATAFTIIGGLGGWAAAARTKGKPPP